jgi:hypothetical protein
MVLTIGVIAGILFLGSPFLAGAMMGRGSREMPAQPLPVVRPSFAVIPPGYAVKCECGKGFVPPF